MYIYSVFIQNCVQTYTPYVMEGLRCNMDKNWREIIKKVKMLMWVYINCLPLTGIETVMSHANWRFVFYLCIRNAIIASLVSLVNVNILSLIDEGSVNWSSGPCGRCKELLFTASHENFIEENRNQLVISHYKPFWKCVASDIIGGRVHLGVWWIDEQRLLQSTG